MLGYVQVEVSEIAEFVELQLTLQADETVERDVGVGSHPVVLIRENGPGAPSEGERIPFILAVVKIMVVLEPGHHEYFFAGRDRSDQPEIGLLVRAQIVIGAVGHILVTVCLVHHLAEDVPGIVDPESEDRTLIHGDIRFIVVGELRPQRWVAGFIEIGIDDADGGIQHAIGRPADGAPVDQESLKVIARDLHDTPAQVDVGKGVGTANGERCVSGKGLLPDHICVLHAHPCFHDDAPKCFGTLDVCGMDVFIIVVGIAPPVVRGGGASGGEEIFRGIVKPKIRGFEAGLHSELVLQFPDQVGLRREEMGVVAEIAISGGGEGLRGKGLVHQVLVIAVLPIAVGEVSRPFRTQAVDLMLQVQALLDIRVPAVVVDQGKVGRCYFIGGKVNEIRLVVIVAPGAVQVDAGIRGKLPFFGQLIDQAKTDIRTAARESGVG